MDVECIFELPIPSSNALKLLEFAERHNHVAQYYNGMTGEVQAVPKSEEHKQLLARYAELVGKEQTMLGSYESAIEKSLSSKILILSNDVDSLINESMNECFDEIFHIIRGSPFPFFVEFLDKNVSKGMGLVRLCENIGGICYVHKTVLVM